MGFKLFFVLAFGLLAIRAFDPNRFSAWDFGDAQTMMAATVSRDEGFWATSFLWVPQPSSPIGKFIDDDAVRHHAHGSGGDQKFSGLGPKRMYTHWPSWYSVPYGVFAKLGVWNKTVYQLWAALLSVAALVFFYLFLREVAGEEIARIATVFYFLTPAFLQYSDSLATMPYDDFFRMAFLWRWVERKKKPSPWNRIYLPSFLYLGAFVTALDSFAFIPVAAFVSDWLQDKKVYFKDLTILVGFGIAALGIQWLQNSSYLGWNGAWRDWQGYFLANGGLKFFDRVILCLSVFVRAFNLTLFFVFLVMLLAWIVSFSLEKGKEIRVWLVTLTLAGAAFGAIVSGKAPMEYESRQLIPLAALCFAVVVVAFEKLFCERAASHGVIWSSWYKGSFLGAAFLVFLGNIYAYDLGTIKEVVDYPASTHIPPYRRELLEKIKADAPGHRVYFQIGRVLSTKKYVRQGYGQVNPVDEFYAEGPVLTVPDYASLIEDLNYFWKKAEGQFQPILLVHKAEQNAPPAEIELGYQTRDWKLGRTWRSLDIEAYTMEISTPQQSISQHP